MASIHVIYDPNSKLEIGHKLVEHIKLGVASLHNVPIDLDNPETVEFIVRSLLELLLPQVEPP